MNLPFVVGLAGVVAIMSVGGGLLQERSRWLAVWLWVVVLVVGVAAWSVIAGPRPVWSDSRWREHLPTVVLVGVPSLACLVGLLVFRHRALLPRIAASCGLGIAAAVIAPYLSLWIACVVTGDCL